MSTPLPPTWITPDRLFDGQSILTGRSVALRDGNVAEIMLTDSLLPDAAPRAVPGLLTPGFFDIQVNGGGGALLNNAPTAETLAIIAAAHRRFGTTRLLPTLISDTAVTMTRTVDALLDHGLTGGIAGLHLEGPHLAPARRGTHRADTLRPLDDATMAEVTRLRAADIPTLITLAPEAASLHQIRALTDMGATVSLGHSAADFTSAQAAFAAGATCVTHLFNAMPAMESRAPGLVGATLDGDAYAGIIADGIHVDPAVVTLASRARRSPHRMIAVSDAMATVGGPDHFDLYGQNIRLSEGRLVNAEGALAGAHLTLSQALKNLTTWGIGLADALAMCITTPAALMGLPTDVLGQSTDDLLLLSDDLDVIAVGARVTTASS